MSDTLVAETTAESRRLAALRAYRVLDSAAEREFDDIAVLAAQLCRTPVAAVSLVDADRQWFKARVGLTFCETSRKNSFCAYVMRGDDLMQVPDARTDPRFAGNPLVTGEPNIVFYAGAPLVTAAGEVLGTLCVIDYEPRLLTPAECHGLRTLARHVMAQLELRRYAHGLDATHERLRDADRIKDEFISRVTHELRTPLTSINGYLEMLGDDVLGQDTGAEFLTRIRRNSDRLIRLVDDMLLAAQAAQEELRLTRRVVDLAALVHDAVERNGVLAENRGLSIAAYAPAPVLVEADEHRLAQVLERLLLNAVKFTPRGGITVTAVRRDRDAVLVVHDTGIGIGVDEQRWVLEGPFRRGAEAQRADVPGAGLGLSIVKAIVESHGGTVRIDSSTGEGTAIVVTLPRA